MKARPAPQEDIRWTCPIVSRIVSRSVTELLRVTVCTRSTFDATRAHASLKISDVFTIAGSQISEIYVKNKMTVHFQGMSKTLQFPQTIALQGAPTCSIGISPRASTTG